MGFSDKLARTARRNHSWLCVGLDPDLDKIPYPLKARYRSEALVEFNRRIVEATADLVCAYKLNSAFYEVLGPRALELLRATRQAIGDDIPVILDAKRGDIAHSARHYAKTAFDVYGADAVTVSPYLGFDAIEPFFDYRDRGVFVLCRTSNPGARNIQDLNCGGRPLYQRVAELALRWKRETKVELGLVMGATYPDELSIVREIVGDEMLMLIPGVGAQAGDLERAAKAAMDVTGERAIISVSRGVLYASTGEDFAQAARREAERLREEINRFREATSG